MSPKPKKKKSPEYPVPALEKGLDILEALAAAAVPASLAGLAESLGRSRSELFRMLNCLERRGYVTRDEVSAKYELSLKLFTLAHGHTPAAKLVQAARLPMQALTTTIRESCHLSILDRGHLLVLAQEQSPEPVRISIEIGGLFPAPRTASGRLLLAHLDDSERSSFFKGHDARQQFESASAVFEKIRRTGVSTAESETIEGVRDVAILIGDPTKGVCAALAVTRLLRHGERPDDSAILSAMRLAVQQINGTLGLS